ncbi:MAG: hypothetical protein DRI36_05445, partial [Caldiserica bacterium]
IEENEELPFDFSLTLSYMMFFDNLKFFLQYSSLRGETLSFLWRLSDNFVLRGGYNFEDYAFPFFLGFGIGWKNLNFDISVSQFSYTNPVYLSVNYKFGKVTKLLRYKKEIERTKRRAIRYYREGDLFKARDEFLKILSINPDDEDSKFYVERIEFELSSLTLKEEENRIFEEALKKYLEGDLMRSFELFSNVLLINPEHKEAKEYLKKVKEDIEYIEKLFLIKEYLNEIERFEKKGNFAKALEIIDESLKEIGKEPRIERKRKEIIKKLIASLIMKGKFYFSRKRYDEALKVYEKILKYEPENKIAKEMIGKIQAIKLSLKGKGEVVGVVVDSEYDSIEDKFYLTVKAKKEIKPGEVLIVKGKGRVKILEKIGKNLYDAVMLDSVKVSSNDLVIRIR